MHCFSASIQKISESDFYIRLCAKVLIDRHQQYRISRITFEDPVWCNRNVFTLCSGDHKFKSWAVRCPWHQDCPCCLCRRHGITPYQWQWPSWGICHPPHICRKGQLVLSFESILSLMFRVNSDLARLCDLWPKIHHFQIRNNAHIYSTTQSTTYGKSRFIVLHKICMSFSLGSEKKLSISCLPS